MINKLYFKKRPKFLRLVAISGLTLTLVSLADLVVPSAPPVAPEIVDSSKIIAFEAGKAASAAEMNQTIQELVRVIDLNGRSLQQLRDRVASLEGQVASLQPNNSVVGRKYKIAQMILLYRNSTVDFVVTSDQRFADNLVTVTFNNNGTATVITNYTERELTISHNTSNGFSFLGYDPISTEVENLTVPYTQNGNAVTMFGVTFYVSTDGRSIIQHDGTGEGGQEGSIMSGVEITNN